jgi:hypothetical protein
MPRGKAKQLSPEELAERHVTRLQAGAELERLKSHWPELRRTISAEALIAAWFLYGDAMFTETKD